MKHPLFFLSLLLAVAISSCQQPSRENIHAPKIYACNQEVQLQVSMNEQAALILIRQGNEVLAEKRLPHVPAATGAKYADDNFTFWEKGDEAVYMEGDSIIYACRKE